MTLGMSPLLDLLCRLLPPEQAEQAELLAANLSPQVLLATLADQGVLTGYQVAEIAAGRGGSLVIGPYVLLEKLGAGGMGEVFRARNRDLGRDEALKRLLPAMLDSPDLIARFERELRAAARLSHPNFVQVYAGGKADGVHYLAMELLPGVNLAQHLRQGGPLPVAEAVDYVRQACVGMQHAHEKRIVHRDLKPANLWLTPQGRVKILDLGLALVAHSTTMTLAGGFFGTVDYVAPEQVSDSHNVDIRADVYSLGCTLYHLLAGQTPFSSALPAARAAMHLTQEPPPLEQVRRDVPADVAAVVRKMMAKKRERRYQTPGEAATALAALLSKTGPAAASGGGSQAPPSVLNRPTQLPATEAIGSTVRPTARPAAPAKATPKRDEGNGETLLAVLMGGALLLLLGCVCLLFLPPVISDGTGPLDEKRENSIGMRFQLIPKGKFLMGATEGDNDAENHEKPRHEVEITKDFYLGTYEVTQKQWKALMKDNPSWFSREGGGKERVKHFADDDLDHFPVETVSWQDAQEFLKQLNERENSSLTGWEYRLPTEAEWEYACRAGAVGKRFHTGDTLSARQANFSDTKLDRTEKVGSYPANQFGLHDMHGNVWEWCHDKYDSKYYAKSPKADPRGPLEGPGHVERGGSWFSAAGNCRSALRLWRAPEIRFNALGFRVALVPAR